MRGPCTGWGPPTSGTSWRPPTDSFVNFSKFTYQMLLIHLKWYGKMIKFKKKTLEVGFLSKNEGQKKANFLSWIYSYSQVLHSFEIGRHWALRKWKNWRWVFFSTLVLSQNAQELAVPVGEQEKKNITLLEIYPRIFAKIFLTSIS